MCSGSLCCCDRSPWRTLPARWKTTCGGESCCPVLSSHRFLTLSGSSLSPFWFLWCLSWGWGVCWRCSSWGSHWRIGSPSASASPHPALSIWWMAMHSVVELEFRSLVSGFVLWLKKRRVPSVDTQARSCHWSSLRKFHGDSCEFSFQRWSRESWAGSRQVSELSCNWRWKRCLGGFRLS